MLGKRALSILLLIRKGVSFDREIRMGRDSFACCMCESNGTVTAATKCISVILSNLDPTVPSPRRISLSRSHLISDVAPGCRIVLGKDTSSRQQCCPTNCYYSCHPWRPFDHHHRRRHHRSNLLYELTAIADSAQDYVIEWLNIVPDDADSPLPPPPFIPRDHHLRKRRRDQSEHFPTPSMSDGHNEDDEDDHRGQGSRKRFQLNLNATPRPRRLPAHMSQRRSSSSWASSYTDDSSSSVFKGKRSRSRRPSPTKISR